jgi:hypothetical protein
MANRPISELTEMTAAQVSTADSVLVYDTSDDTERVKRATVGNLISIADGTFSSFTVAADGGSPETIGQAATMTIKGADTSIFCAAQATDTITIKANTSTMATVAHVASVNLSSIADVTSPSAIQGDILYYNTGNWTSATPGTAGLSPEVGSTNLITLGAIVAGTWQSTPVATMFGGTGKDFSSSSAANTGVVVINDGVATLARPGLGSIDSCLDEDDLTSNSATALVTQQSVKAYVDNNITSQIAVTVADDGSSSQNVFALDGQQMKTSTHIRPTIRLQKGMVYRFDVSAGSNSGHILRFSITPDGTHTGGSEYTTGVESVGTAGTANAKVNITTAWDTPDILYIYCATHAGMGGAVGPGADDQRTPVYTSDKLIWLEIDGARTMSGGDCLLCDVSTSSMIVTLPQTGVMGDHIRIVDASQNAASNNITINRNAHKIDGATSNFVMSTDGQVKELVYYNATRGWITV